MLANAKRDIQEGHGLLDNMDRIKMHLEEAMAKFNFNVLVLTEFHRQLDPVSYAEFLEFAKDKLGLAHYRGYKKNIPHGDQCDGYSPINPMAFETIVFTTFPVAWCNHYEFNSRDATEDRPYPLSNGCIAFPFKDRTFVAVHSSLSFGQRDSDVHKDVLNELKLMQGPFFKNPLIVGDFNITDGLTKTLENDHPALLKAYQRLPKQADFICLPEDWIDEAFLVPNTQFANGFSTAPIEEKEGKVRIVSTLSMIGAGWTEEEIQTARFVHPWDLNLDITNMSPQEVAVISRKMEDNFRSTGTPRLPFDHAGMFITIA